MVKHICIADCTDGALRLVGGSTDREGRVRCVWVVAGELFKQISIWKFLKLFARANHKIKYWTSTTHYLVTVSFQLLYIYMLLQQSTLTSLCCIYVTSFTVWLQSLKTCLQLLIKH